ncbi:hypothetical protein C8R46DRAFT_1031478 [Mycena filopes]|nr:hypothetical protein C8R46DRAFT_1031478 [Mycena filopes]
MYVPLPVPAIELPEEPALSSTPYPVARRVTTPHVSKTSGPRILLNYSLLQTANLERRSRWIILHPPEQPTNTQHWTHIGARLSAANYTGSTPRSTRGQPNIPPYYTTRAATVSETSGPRILLNYSLLQLGATLTLRAAASQLELGSSSGPMSRCVRSGEARSQISKYIAGEATKKTKSLTRRMVERAMRCCNESAAGSSTLLSVGERKAADLRPGLDLDGSDNESPDVPNEMWGCAEDLLAAGPLCSSREIDLQEEIGLSGIHPRSRLGLSAVPSTGTAVTSTGVERAIPSRHRAVAKIQASSTGRDGQRDGRHGQTGAQCHQQPIHADPSGIQ